MYEITKAGIHYQIEGGMALLKSCGDVEGELTLPDAVEGAPVRGIAPYAFSEKKITELRLPKFLEEIGRYVFYRCFDLKRLCFCDTWKDIGAGAFTGCSLEEIEIDFYRGEQSCLKFILDEVRYTLLVTMRYHRQDGGVDTAKLIFPEHYEEAVENTPARIVETHYHGAGGYYRQCFYNRELNYAEYDSLFFHAEAEEDETTAVDIAAYRLYFPFRLGEKARIRYEQYLKEHIVYAGRRFVLREDTALLRFLGIKGYWSEEALDVSIEAAAQRGKTEMLSVLMEERRIYFPKKKKVFEL